MPKGPIQRQRRPRVAVKKASGVFVEKPLVRVKPKKSNYRRNLALVAAIGTTIGFLAHRKFKTKPKDNSIIKKIVNSPVDVSVSDTISKLEVRIGIIKERLKDVYTLHGQSIIVKENIEVINEILLSASEAIGQAKKRKIWDASAKDEFLKTVTKDIADAEKFMDELP